MQISPEHWDRVRDLFHKALDFPPDERAAFLSTSCSDPALRDEVESLLANADTGQSDLLDSPALEGVWDAVQGVIATSTGHAPADQPRPSLGSGTLLGPYRIVSMIATGGMGQVYRAVDTRLNRNVALKVLPPDMAHDANRMARFVRESKALASLNHPNIVAVYDVGENFIVTELVGGGSLRGRSFPLRKTLDVISQVAEGLGAAHSAGIIHRDIKPENILLTEAGRVKLVDFGVALQSRSVGLQTAVTQPGMIVGTAAYMSPEQVQGSPEIDSRSDIFSLGLVLHEMLSGRSCFAQTSPIAVMNAIVHEAPPELSEDVPLPVRQLVSRCLEKDPSQRFQSATDLAFNLRGSMALGVATTGSIRKPDAPTTARIKWWWIAGLSAAMILEAAVLLLLPHNRPAAGVQPLMKFIVPISGAADIDQGITPALSADGTRIAFPSIRADGKQQLMLQRLDQTSAAPLAGTEGAYAPFFSAEGDAIGFFTNDGYLKKISFPGDTVVTLSPAPSARGASWGENGDIVLAPGPMSGLVRIPPGGSPETVTSLSGGSDVTHRWPQILPGGDTILFTAHNTTSSFENASIKALSLRDRTVKLIYKGGYFARYIPTSGDLIFVHNGKLLGAAFDSKKLQLKGPPQPVLDDLAGDSGTGDGRFNFSRTGLFAYQSAGVPLKRQLAWLYESGKTEPLMVSRGNYFFPRISPDGSRVLLQTGGSLGGDLFMLDLQSGAVVALTFNGKQNKYAYPIWAPDGKHVVFSYTPEGEMALGWLSVGRPGDIQVLVRSKHFKAPYSFSPDGKLLAYSELTDETAYDISVLPVDLRDPDHPEAGSPELLLNSNADEGEPTFSPDGRWLAYMSTESGVFEVYVCRYPRQTGKWLISSGGGRLPIWSRKQNILFYQNAEGRIMTVAYRVAGDTFAPGPPKLWSGEQLSSKSGFLHAPWNLDMAPDGKRFAVFPAADEHEIANALPTVLYVNFFDEIIRRIHR